MTRRDHVDWGHEQADESQSDMRRELSDGMLGGYWTVAESIEAGASGGS